MVREGRRTEGKRLEEGEEGVGWRTEASEWMSLQRGGGG